MDDGERYERGMATRREVLGEAHVKRAEANKNEFNEDFHDLITRYAWGDIWQRPGLDRRTRSFMTLSMLLALNRGEEFALHVKAALNNGLTREEIKEVLLHASIYCGVPTVNHGFRLAQETFAALDAEI